MAIQVTVKQDATQHAAVVSGLNRIAAALEKIAAEDDQGAAAVAAANELAKSSSALGEAVRLASESPKA